MYRIVIDELDERSTIAYFGTFEEALGYCLEMRVTHPHIVTDIVKGNA